jgi:hypothetical protein
MAKIMSPLYSAKASGKFMAMVFQSWRGLAVVREFEAPTQPNTARQVSVRAIFTEISKYWANTLTEGLRQAWANFVFRWTDLWGNEISLTGLNLFQKFNFILRDSGRAFQTTTPPPIIPPDPFVEGMTNTSLYFEIEMGQLTMAEVVSQDIFLDVWIAGIPSAFQVVQSPVENVANIQVQTDGLPQGVNPVSSDYRHLTYLTPIVNPEQPIYAQKTLFRFTPAAGGNWLSKRKISLIIRHHNKFGNYSAPLKISEITVIA